MGYYNKIPRILWSSLPVIKNDIYHCSIVSCYHFIAIFLIVCCTNPWPSDFRDNGFYVLLSFMIYLFIVNLLNCLFLYDEYLESTAKDQQFGPVFKLCKTIRHIIFWIFGLYVQLAVIYVGIYKMNIALRLQLYDLYTIRTCFLIWSVICFCFDLYWIMKTCIYHQLTIHESFEHILQK